MVDLVSRFAAETDTAKKRHDEDLQKLHTENVYTLGVVIGRYAASKTLKNVPIAAPAFHQWDYNNFTRADVIRPPTRARCPKRSQIIPQYKQA